MGKSRFTSPVSSSTSNIACLTICSFATTPRQPSGQLAVHGGVQRSHPLVVHHQGLHFVGRERVVTRQGLGVEFGVQRLDALLEAASLV